MNKKIITIFIVLIGIVVIYFLLPEKKPLNYPPKNQVVVAFGDSLVRGVGSTEGSDFISVLSKNIGKEIINQGVPGDTTIDGLKRIDQALVLEPGTTIILLGGNDYLKKVPQEETFENLRQIISKFQAQGSMVVLLGIRGGLLNDRFDSDFEKLAKEMRVIYVSDVLDGLIADSRYMSDAVHPNNAGYIKIADRVYKAIENYLK